MAYMSTAYNLFDYWTEYRCRKARREALAAKDFPKYQAVVEMKLISIAENVKHEQPGATVETVRHDEEWMQECEQIKEESKAVFGDTPIVIQIKRTDLIHNRFNKSGNDFKISVYQFVPKGQGRDKRNE